MGDPRVVAALGERRHAGALDVDRAHAGDLEEPDLRPRRPASRRCPTRRFAIHISSAAARAERVDRAVDPRRRTRPTPRPPRARHPGRPRPPPSRPASRRTWRSCSRSLTELSTEPESYTLHPSTLPFTTFGNSGSMPSGRLIASALRLRVADDRHGRRGRAARSSCPVRRVVDSASTGVAAGVGQPAMRPSRGAAGRHDGVRRRSAGARRARTSPRRRPRSG